MVFKHETVCLTAAGICMGYLDSVINVMITTRGSGIGLLLGVM